MLYTIQSYSQNEDGLTTQVEFDYDGVLVECAIQHFQPADAAAVHDACLNRAASEQRKLAAAATCEALCKELAAEQGKPVEAEWDAGAQVFKRKGGK